MAEMADTSWIQGEPALEEALTDDLVLLVMSRDGLDPMETALWLLRIAKSLADPSGST